MLRRVNEMDALQALCSTVDLAPCGHAACVCGQHSLCWAQFKNPTAYLWQCEKPTDALENLKAGYLWDAQYEEPTDALQALRESVELAHAAALPWLRERASAAVAALPPDAPAANGTPAVDGAAAAAATEHGRLGANAEAEAGSLHLALAAASVARAQAELRLPKQQARGTRCPPGASNIPEGCRGGTAVPGACNS